jgi:hypothetical protein
MLFQCWKSTDESPKAATPAQFGATMRNEIETMQGLAKQTGISSE